MNINCNNFADGISCGFSSYSYLAPRRRVDYYNRQYYHVRSTNIVVHEVVFGMQHVHKGHNTLYVNIYDG